MVGKKIKTNSTLFIAKIKLIKIWKTRKRERQNQEASSGSITWTQYVIIL
jgi:hypothetical protein